MGQSHATRHRAPNALPPRQLTRLIDRAALCDGWAQPSLHELDERQARRWAAQLLPLGERAAEPLALAARHGGTRALIADRTGWLLLTAAALQLADTRQALADERAAHARATLRLVVAEVLTDGRARL